MLGKLIKHEYIYLVKTFTPIYIIFLASALGLQLFSLSGFDFKRDPDGSPMYYSATVIFFCLVAAFTILSSVMALLTMVDNIRRFKNNLFTDEGYLTNTLPVTATEHIAAKLIAGATNYLCSFAVLLLGAFIASRETTSSVVGFLWDEVTDPDVSLDVKLSAVLMSFMAYISIQLLGYLSTALNNMVSGSKGLLGGIVGAAALILGMMIIARAIGVALVNGLSPAASMLMISIILLVFCAAMYFIIVNIMKKHLNLQ